MPRPGLAVLAAIGKIESDHGRSALPGVAPGTVNAAGAGGQMQILGSTWQEILARHQIPPGGANPPSRWNAHDAIYAAAFYLCDHNISHDPHGAIFAYNHADWYVNQVLAQAALYRGGAAASGSPSQDALVAVAFAQSQLGQPYVWGGDGAAEGGFDCSGLTHAAYAAAGISIPRTAHTQYQAGPLLPPGTPLQPGDLVFFSASPGRITHAGIAISVTHMINAPFTGAVIRVDPVGRYIAASRPAPATAV
jgi:cell wall-associated NlpC family hydrolase